MQIETENFDKRAVAKRKERWAEEAHLPAELEPMREKYALIEVGQKYKRIDPDDVLKVINVYAQDLSMETYDIAKLFNLSGTALTDMLKRDEFKEAWKLAKKVRASKALQEGYAAANTPYDLIMKGRQISGLLVKAASLKANFNLHYASVLDPELQPSRSRVNAEGDINIQVNAAFNVKDL